MAFSPIAFVIPQYDKAKFKNWWLKAYEPGTLIPKPMATDGTGAVQAAKYQLNSEGFPVTAGDANVIPFVDGSYDMWLFPTAAEADANDTTNAEQFADNITGVNGSILANSMVISFGDLNEAENETSLELIFDGAALNIAERTAGNGGGAMWDVVLTSSVTPNTFDIVQSIGIPTLSFVLRVDLDFDGKEFGMMFDDLTDDTLAFRAVLAAALPSKSVVQLSAGTTLITDSISCPIGTKWKGVKDEQYHDGFGVDPLGTKINFQPTTPKRLFVTDGPDHAGFRFHYYFANAFISTNADGIAAIDLNGVIYSHFENITTDGFTHAVECEDTINNRFVNCFFGDAETACVLYDAGVPTTDVWTQCTFFRATSGVTFSVGALSIRFVNCLFEQIGRFGLNMVAECQNIILDECYAEDVVFDGGAGDSFARVGASGTAVVTNNLTIIGGTYNGRNAGNAGSFVNANLVSGIQLLGPTVSRFDQVITASASVADNSIFISGIQGISWTNGFYVGPDDKLQGTYPQTTLGAANYGFTSDVRHSIAEKFLPTANNDSDIGTDALRIGFGYIRDLLLGNTGGTATLSGGANSPEGVRTATVSSIWLRSNGGANTSFYVKESGTGNTGWIAK